MADNTERVRALNDALRTTSIGGKIMLTRSVAELPSLEQAAIVESVKSFTNFTLGNDPHGEHDCAMLTAANQQIIFKIDYFDLTLTHWSVDRSDPRQTCRVLTIMLADDY